MITLLKFAKPGKSYSIKAILGKDKLINGLEEGLELYIVKNTKHELILQCGDKRKGLSKTGTERIVLSSISNKVEE